jgi:hypothetical protein
VQAAGRAEGGRAAQREDDDPVLVVVGELPVEQLRRWTAVRPRRRRTPSRWSRLRALRRTRAPSRLLHLGLPRTRPGSCHWPVRGYLRGSWRLSEALDSIMKARIVRARTLGLRRTRHGGGGKAAASNVLAARLGQADGRLTVGGCVAGRDATYPCEMKLQVERLQDEPAGPGCRASTPSQVGDTGPNPVGTTQVAGRFRPAPGLDRVTLWITVHAGAADL